MIQPSLLEVAVLSGDAEVVAEQVRGQDHLGREHFIAFGRLVLDPPAESMAILSFSTLVVRKAYPLDRRKTDFESLGLEIVQRAEAGLGKIPEFARYHASSSASAKQEDYAVGTESLVRLVAEDRGRPIRLQIIGQKSLKFLVSLTKELGRQK